MPKNKQPKNAYYYFMLDFKERQQKKGIHYEDLKAVAAAADPEWRNAPTHVRVVFEEMARQEKFKHNRAPTKYTSTGIPIDVIKQRNQELKESDEFERQDIQNMVRLKAFNLNSDCSLLDEYFYVIDVNDYCKVNDNYLIAECTILRFNLRNSFRDFYHELINPGYIPCGYASDIKINCKEFGLNMPDDEAPASNYMVILANIEDYLKYADKNVKTLPPLYTMTDKVPAVKDFFQTMCDKAGEDEGIYRIYRLEILFYQIMSAIKTKKDEGFPKESLAGVQLKRDLFKYSPGLGCEHHEKIDKSVECTTSRVKRWVYTILDCCCPIVNIDLKPGMHIPLGYDVEEILSYKNNKKEERGAHTLAEVANTSSSFNDSRDCSSSNASYVSDVPHRETAPYRKMRMPRRALVTPTVAPELTGDEGPVLSLGASRGRGITSSFKRLNL